MSSSIFAVELRQFLSHALAMTPQSFMIFACCHINSSGRPSVDGDIIKGFTSNGIVVTVMPKSKSGQADMAIKSHLSTFFEMFDSPGEDRVVVLISSDSDFQSDVSTAKLKGAKVVVMYREDRISRHYKDFCLGVGGGQVQLWQWEDVLSSIVRKKVTGDDIRAGPQPFQLKQQQQPNLQGQLQGLTLSHDVHDPHTRVAVEDGDEEGPKEDPSVQQKPAPLRLCTYHFDHPKGCLRGAACAFSHTPPPGFREKVCHSFSSTGTCPHKVCIYKHVAK